MVAPVWWWVTAVGEMGRYVIVFVAGLIVARRYLRTRSRRVGLLGASLLVLGCPLAIMVAIAMYVWIAVSVQRGQPLEGTSAQFYVLLSRAVPFLVSIQELVGFSLLGLLALQLDSNTVRRLAVGVTTRWRAFAQQWLP